jgi:DNA modification methylase
MDSIMEAHVFEGSCDDYFSTYDGKFDLTFLDPPFNQGKDYRHHDDKLSDEQYWSWMGRICEQIFQRTTTGGALYFMQREKNAEFVLRCLRETGWTFQNLIIWKKKTSAVPGSSRYGKHYQIIAYATKGKTPRVFNKLRISPPLPANYKYDREDGMFVTDVWDDIRELTSGYFAGDEALRKSNGERFHAQQAPIALLLRIILSSSKLGDVVLDPFAGTGTTLVVAEQLGRQAIGVELDPYNVTCTRERLQARRSSDSVERFRKDYQHTEKLDNIWPTNTPIKKYRKEEPDVLDLPLFRGLGE